MFLKSLLSQIVYDFLGLALPGVESTVKSRILCRVQCFAGQKEQRFHGMFGIVAYSVWHMVMFCHNRLVQDLRQIARKLVSLGRPIAVGSTCVRVKKPFRSGNVNIASFVSKNQ